MVAFEKASFAQEKLGSYGSTASLVSERRGWRIRVCVLMPQTVGFLFASMSRSSSSSIQFVIYAYWDAGFTGRRPWHAAKHLESAGALARESGSTVAEVHFLTFKSFKYV